MKNGQQVDGACMTCTIRQLPSVQNFTLPKNKKMNVNRNIKYLIDNQRNGMQNLELDDEGC